MNEQERENLTGHPSDYGSRTLAGQDRQRADDEDANRTADGEPRVERGTADSAITDENDGDLESRHSSPATHPAEQQ